MPVLSQAIDYRLAIVLALLMFHGFASARTGDELVVTGSVVNLRAEPSLESRVLLRVARGRKLVEISRYQGWVEVATRRSDIDTGWIHESLLSITGQDDSSTPAPAFTAFLGEFNRINNSLTDAGDERPLLDVEQTAPGELRITAAAPWFALEQSQRESVISGLFEFWQQQNDVGSGLSLEVVDRDGQPHMMIFR